MSFLLTPVALICPIIGAGGTNIPQQTQFQQHGTHAAPSAQSQAICRIHQHEQGPTDISIGTHSLAIYPIHYAEHPQQHLVFASKLLSQHRADVLQVWTGDLYAQQVSSNMYDTRLATNELQLISLTLNDSFDATRDFLCLSFQNNNGSYSSAQIQLRSQS